MSTAVVIPNWNGAGLLREYLPSVMGQRGADGERVGVVVVDNGSTDDSVSVARGLGAEVIALAGNLGFAGAVNRGVAAITERWVAIVNNDVRLAPGWLAVLQGAMEETGAAVGAGRIWRDGAPGPTVDGSFDLMSRGATAWRVGAGWPARKSGALDARREVKMVSLTAALVRREAFDRVGPLDEDFESYLEDIEFGLRCARLGLKAVYEPAAEAWHRGSATLGAWHAETARRIARNQMMIVSKHYPPGWLARYGWAVFAGQLLWGAVAARHGAGMAYLRGKQQGLEGYSGWRERSRWARRDDDLPQILDAMERELAELALAPSTSDAYWQWYFRLTGRPERARSAGSNG